MAVGAAEKIQTAISMLLLRGVPFEGSFSMFLWANNNILFINFVALHTIKPGQKLKVKSRLPVEFQNSV